MKFKNNEGYSELSITDSDDDKLRVTRYDNDKGKPENKLYLTVSGPAGGVVILTKAKALKLALEIIEEFHGSGI